MERERGLLRRDERQRGALELHGPPPPPTLPPLTTTRGFPAYSKRSRFPRRSGKGHKPPGPASSRPRPPKRRGERAGEAPRLQSPRGRSGAPSPLTVRAHGASDDDRVLIR